MIKSMTGYANLTHEEENYQYNLEIKSVNNRYLNINCNIPESLYQYEHTIIEQIKKYILRGKIELKITIKSLSQNQNINLDTTLLKNLANIDKRITKKYTNIKHLSTNDILKYPGIQIQKENKFNFDIINNLIIHLIENFDNSRKKEGGELYKHIITRIENIKIIINKIIKIHPEVIKNYQNKIKNRIIEIINELDDFRLKQEFAFFIQKYDIDEELNRLQIHIENLINTIENDTYSGKKIDFILQEINRETNTIGSKSISTDISKLIIELKVLIEQIREQSQNIE